MRPRGGRLRQCESEIPSPIRESATSCVAFTPFADIEDIETGKVIRVPVSEFVAD